MSKQNMIPTSSSICYLEGRPLLIVFLIAIGCQVMCGCSSSKRPEERTVETNEVAAETAQANIEAAVEDVGITNNAGRSASPINEAIELSVEDLLSAQLSQAELADGWVRLFDGQSLFGWFAFGDADWSVADGVIRVSEGERSYLCTSFQISDFELELDFRSDATTNSGVFLRTEPEPQDVATESLELNIAPPDNAFPTGSFVNRQKLSTEELGDFDTDQWHTYRVRLEGSHVQVALDGRDIMDFEAESVSPRGYISLQHNSGRVEFKNIRMRPIHSEHLVMDSGWESSWIKSQTEGVDFQVEADDKGIHLTGGLGQLESKNQYDDFFLNASYSLARPDVNSGIFFRCIPGKMLDGYECQVNHAMVEGNPLQPADAGAGAIFRRVDARLVVGDGTKPTHIAILASGPQIATWVNGVQMVDFLDQRAPDENPRRGLRTQAGTIAIQAHDPTTDVVFYTVAVSSL